VSLPDEIDVVVNVHTVCQDRHGGGGGTDADIDKTKRCQARSPDRDALRETAVEENGRERNLEIGKVEYSFESRTPNDESPQPTGAFPRTSVRAEPSDPVCSDMKVLGLRPTGAIGSVSTSEIDRPKLKAAQDELAL